MKMMNFFQEQIKPKIYGYTETSPEFNGLIKVGYTEETSRKTERTQRSKGPEDVKRN